jgi:hypothetical protein
MFMKKGVKKAEAMGALSKAKGIPKDMVNRLASMSGGKGGAMGKLASSSSGGASMMEMLDKLPPDIKNKLMADRASKVGIKKGGKISKAKPMKAKAKPMKAKTKPMKAKTKSTKTVKKQSGHNRLY